MKALNRLFSMLAAIVVSAVLPFSMAAENEADQHQSYSNTKVISSVSGEGEKQDDEPA